MMRLVLGRALGRPSTARRVGFGVVGALLAGGLAACSLGDSSSDQESQADGVVAEPIIGGTAATEFPEAGYLNMPMGGGKVGLCSATLIAPKVVLTAGHCVDGFTQWEVYIGSVLRTSTRGETFDWKENGATTVNPNHHDLGLVYLDSPINITRYPTLAQTKSAAGTTAINVGRILNDVVTNSLWKASTVLKEGTTVGYPYDYSASVVIQHGDSGGPVFLTGTHTLVAVNSGAGTTIEVLARVDLLYSWIQERIASNGKSTATPDAGTGDAGVKDSGTTDSGIRDAGAADSGTSDSGIRDAGAADSGTSDSGIRDAGTTDSGTVDSGAKPADAGTTDAGSTSDAGSRDAGTVDSGVTTPADAGAPLCTTEKEPNNSLSLASTFTGSACGAISTTTDEDWYRFTAKPGKLVVSLAPTADASFSVGVVTVSSGQSICAPLASALKSVQISVSGSARDLCFRVTSPAKKIQSYTLIRSAG